MMILKNGTNDHMTDYLNIKMETEDILAISNLGLAHIGDCVYELMVRSWIIVHGKLTCSSLHHAAVQYVSAPAQAKAYERIADMLSEEESSVFKRGRNTKVNSVPKNADRAQYHTATGLESLFGWLYLNGLHERLNELFAKIMENE